MDAIYTLLKLKASSQRNAVRRTCYRHCYIYRNPIFIVGYHLAGDIGAPLAIMWEEKFDSHPNCVVVPEPRDRECRFEALEKFGSSFIEYLEKIPSGEAPQVVIPNASTAEWLFGIVGRFTRHLKTENSTSSEEFVSAPESVPVAGQYLSLFHGLAPGSSLALPLTEVLSTHWVTGQLSSEDMNLSSILGWILPESDKNGLEAARVGELLPPAGPISDPNWDAKELSKIVDKWHKANSIIQKELVKTELEDLVRGQLNHTWNDCMRAYQLLDDLPVANSVEKRWQVDCDFWTKQSLTIQEGTARFRSIPSPIQSAKRLSKIECDTLDFEADMALDDPMVMAKYVASGEALRGIVSQIELDNKILLPGKKRLSCRPLIYVVPKSPFMRPIGTQLFLATETLVEVEVTSVDENEVLLQVVSGANSKQTFNRIPDVGEDVTFSSIKGSEYYPPLDLIEVPWTHMKVED